MLIVMRGTSCSGKDTFVNHYFNEENVLSSDKFRSMYFGDPGTMRNGDLIFGRICEILEQRLANRVPYTVVNATNLKFKDVRRYYELAEKYHTKCMVISIIPPSLEELIQRNEKRFLQTGLNIPIEVLTNHHKRYYDTLKTFNEFNDDESKEFQFVEVNQGFLDNEITILRHRALEINAEDRNLSVWSIGDVHGCATEFRSLCEQIRQKDPDAIIIQNGDLIDRGPDLKKVFDVISEFDVRMIIGNHELNFIQELYELKSCRSQSRAKTHDLYKKLSKKQQEYIKDRMWNSYDFIQMSLNGKKYMLSHSVPKNGMLPINQQNSWFHCSRNTPVESGEFSSEFVFVHGHQHWNYTDIDEQIQNVEKTGYLNIDSGCVYGGELIAVRLNDYSVIRVKSNYNYDENVL